MLFLIEIQPETGSQNLISRQHNLPPYVPVNKLRHIKADDGEETFSS